MTPEKYVEQKGKLEPFVSEVMKQTGYSETIVLLAFEKVMRQAWDDEEYAASLPVIAARVIEILT